MRKKGKWMGVLAGALMMVAAAATGRETKAAVVPEVSFTIGSIDAQVGDTVDVTMHWTGKGTSGASCTMQYDHQALELQGNVSFEGAIMTAPHGDKFGFLGADVTITAKFKVLSCKNSQDLVLKTNYASQGADSVDYWKNYTGKVNIAHPEDQKQTDEKLPNCTEDGYRRVTCGMCGKEISNETLPKTGHTAGDWKVTKEPTCAEEGTKEIHCTVCDALMETQTIPATGAHDYEWKVVKEASCTEAGSKEGTCKVCHATTEEEIPVKAHTMGEWKVSKEPTCTEAGTEIRICSECKKYEETRELKALGHKWAVNDSTDKDGWKVVKEATKEEEGSKERVCSRCDYKETAAIEKLEQGGGKPIVTPGGDKPTTTPKPGTTVKPTAAPGKGSGSAAKTGDTTAVGLYTAVALAAVAGLGVLAVRKRKHSHN